MNRKNIVLIAGISFLIMLFCLFAGPKFVNPFNLDPISREILFSIRGPRILVAILVGASLGATGAILQGILRNPLADPYILGISGGAALFACIGLILGITIFGPLTFPLLAFSGAAFSAFIVGAVGYKRGFVLPERLLLAGIGLGFFFSSMVMLIMTLSTAYGERRALLWIFGDLSMADAGLIPSGFFLILIGFTIAISRKNALNALTLGTEIAHSLGFSPSRERLLFFISASLLTATSVSIGGIIGFVGLVMPHVARFFAGSDAKVLIPLSAVLGAGLVVVADTIGRTIIAPTELPSGIITAIIGAPYFLYLLRKKEILGV